MVVLKVVLVSSSSGISSYGDRWVCFMLRVSFMVVSVMIEFIDRLMLLDRMMKFMLMVMMSRKVLFISRFRMIWLDRRFG